MNGRNGEKSRAAGHGRVCEVGNVRFRGLQFEILGFS
jgi:hypothetical protein